VQLSVDAAIAARVDRFVLHSVMHPATPGVRHHQRKASSEAIVRRSPLRWTILQPAMYAQTIMLYWRRSPAGTVIVPYSLDTPFTPVALSDVAEATAVVLTQTGHEFATYELGGPQVLTGREMLAAVCRELGEQRSVRRGKLSELALPPEWSTSARADMAAMCEHYDMVGLTGGGRVLEMLLGQPGTPFQQTIVAP
jgi:NAD(P)H dehydrogenase (quinone)